MNHSARSNGHVSTAPARNGTAAATRLPRRTDDLHQAQALMSDLMSILRDMVSVDEGSDLPLRQLRVCTILARGAQPMSAVGRELGVSLSAMTQIADRLERAGLAVRMLQGTDRRLRRLQLTSAGMKLMQRRDRVRVRRALAMLRRLPPKKRISVMRSLQDMRLACQAAKS